MTTETNEVTATPRRWAEAVMGICCIDNDVGQLDYIASRFELAMAQARAAALEEAAKVFADFKTTPTDEQGRMWTTQEEVERVAANFLALAVRSRTP